MDEATQQKAVRDSASALTLSKRNQERIDDLLKDLPALVQDAVERALEKVPRPSEEECEFLSLAVKSQAQKVKLRQAIIEKTLPALIWAGLAAVGIGLKALVEEWLRAKGIKF